MLPSKKKILISSEQKTPEPQKPGNSERKETELGCQTVFFLERKFDGIEKSWEKGGRYNPFIYYYKTSNYCN